MAKDLLLFLRRSAEFCVFLGPTPTPTRLNNFKPLKLSTALMTVHQDSSHI